MRLIKHLTRLVKSDHYKRLEVVLFTWEMLSIKRLLLLKYTLNPKNYPVNFCFIYWWQRLKHFIILNDLLANSPFFIFDRHWNVESLPLLYYNLAYCKCEFVGLNYPMKFKGWSISHLLWPYKSCISAQVIRRKVVVPADNDFEQPFKVTLNKKNKKDGTLFSSQTYD